MAWRRNLWFVMTALPLVVAGCEGSAGVDGVNGTPGPAGSNGPAGPTGSTGPAGPAGSGTPGATGATGPAGTTGATGPAGEAGVTPALAGTVSGTLTYKPGANPIVASGVTVELVPAAGVASVTSGADGTFSLDSVPVGVYTVKFSGNAFASAEVANVVVNAGQTVVVDFVLTATNPLVLTAPVAAAPVGFSKTGVQLDVTVTGGKAPYTYAWTPKTTNPTAATLSDAAIKNPTFATGSLAAIIASKKVIGIEEGLLRTGFAPISAQQLAQMTYNFDCKVTDADGFTKTVTVAVPPATLAQGNKNVPIGQVVIVSLPANTTAQQLTKPNGSAATLNDANTATPWFIPDVVGEYKVAGLTLNAGEFRGASSTCGACHNTALKTAVGGKFKEWGNSAHGNHFFKYMEYDGQGNLVWKKDANGKNIPAPTADEAVFWDAPGAMTTFQFGMTGGEGSHYGKNCIACHTTGYNALADNGGFDDVATDKSWAFPDLKAAFGGDAVTSAPNNTAWNAIPTEVKAMAGMQCESCHGPIKTHASDGTVKPVGEYDVGSCAVCHDKPSNHDRVALWRKSLHSDLELAQDEAAVESRGTSTSCYRCHAAQGFVAYLKNKDQDPSQIVRPTKFADGTSLAAPANCTPGAAYDGSGEPYDPACPCKPASGQTQCLGDPDFYKYLSGLGLNKAEVQPITCAACHDAHSTEIRVSGNTGPLPNGQEAQGAGSGALCMVCHNTRNGARGDFVTVSGSIGGPHAPVQTDLILGQNAYFVGAGGQVSKHYAVKDTCVGCHMVLHPDGMTATNTNHTMNVDETICKSCHSSGVDLEGLNGQFAVATTNLQKALTKAFTKAIGAATEYYVKPSATGATVVKLTAMPTNVAVSGDRNASLILTFASPVSDGLGGTTTTLTVPFRSVSLTATGTPLVLGTSLFATQGIIAKVNWNVGLVSSATTNKAANVIHNPTFVWDVFSATTGKLLASDGTDL